ncbi:MAG: DUF1573 domain-containing protein [Crocinitomicaceae bacterium]
MKKTLVALASLALFACSESGDDSDNGGSIVATTDPVVNSNEFEVVEEKETTTIEYVETNHDFGDVTYPSENIYTFKFKNTGNKPLIIENAKASCGCTVPNKPDEPILPGEMGEMDVIFRPKEGQQGSDVTKRVTVTANTDPAQTYLEISANVLPAIGG